MAALPQDLAHRWRLRLGPQLPGATCSVVLAAKTQSGQDVVLKIPDLRAEERDSIDALREFTGHGGVPILDFDPESRAILMPRLRPGITLADARLSDDEALRICADCIQGLRGCQRVDAAPDLDIFYANLDLLPKLECVEAAMEIYGILRQRGPATGLLHGDLHHYNILRHGNDWIVIDPKGVSGDLSFEIAAFMRNPVGSEISASVSRRRLELFHEILGDPIERLWGWSFVQTVLSAGWNSPGGVDGEWKGTADGLHSLMPEFWS